MYLTYERLAFFSCSIIKISTRLSSCSSTSSLMAREFWLVNTRRICLLTCCQLIRSNTSCQGTVLACSVIGVLESLVIFSCTLIIHVPALHLLHVITQVYSPSSLGFNMVKLPLQFLLQPYSC